MANQLVKLKDLEAAGFGKIVNNVNPMVRAKNAMENDADLLLWRTWGVADFEAAGCSVSVAAACVAALMGLTAIYGTIKTNITNENFPPNEV